MIFKTETGSCYIIVQDKGRFFIKRSSDKDVSAAISNFKVKKYLYLMSMRSRYLLELNSSGMYNKTYAVKGDLPVPEIGKPYEFRVISDSNGFTIKTSPVTEIIELAA